MPTARAFFDEAADVYRVRDEDGRIMADGDGNQLAFDSGHEAEDMLQRRADLFALPVRPLRAHQ